MGVVLVWWEIENPLREPKAGGAPADRTGLSTHVKEEVLGTRPSETHTALLVLLHPVVQGWIQSQCSLKAWTHRQICIRSVVQLTVELVPIHSISNVYYTQNTRK